MRYWIYWNDLVQGPFEIEELLALRAFSSELLICPEEGQEWTPAAAVPEMLPFFQTTGERTGPGAPPPPPPPKQPPLSSPFQGEFFHESSQQEHLFGTNGNSSYTFSPVQDPGIPDIPETPSVMTTPFHFTSIPTDDTPQMALPIMPATPADRPAPHFMSRNSGVSSRKTQ